MCASTTPEWHRSPGILEAVDKFRILYARPVNMEQRRRIHHEITNEIMMELQQKGVCRYISDLEYTGSSYEDVNVARTPTNPDWEFDVMVKLTGVAWSSDLVATAIPGRPGFVTLKRSSIWNAPDILTEETVAKFFSTLQSIINASVRMKETVHLIRHGPAVQMNVHVGSWRNSPKLYSVDMVPAFEVDGVMYVAKPIKDVVEKSTKAWRKSFSVEEKALLRTLDARDSGCRKKVLRILKVLRNREPGLQMLSSYILKTALLQEVEYQRDWRCNQLAARLLDVLGRLEEALRCGYMEHKFIAGLNLLNGISQATIDDVRFRIRRLRSSESAFMRVLNVWSIKAEEGREAAEAAAAEAAEAEETSYNFTQEPLQNQNQGWGLLGTTCALGLVGIGLMAYSAHAARRRNE